MNSKRKAALSQIKSLFTAYVSRFAKIDFNWKQVKTHFDEYTRLQEESEGHACNLPLWEPNEKAGNNSSYAYCERNEKTRMSAYKLTKHIRDDKCAALHWTFVRHKLRASFQSSDFPVSFKDYQYGQLNSEGTTKRSSFDNPGHPMAPYAFCFCCYKKWMSVSKCNEHIKKTCKTASKRNATKATE